MSGIPVADTLETISSGGQADSCFKSSTLFAKRFFYWCWDNFSSLGYGEKLCFAISTISLTEDAVVDPAFATLPTTSATFLIEILLALMNDPAELTARNMLGRHGI